MRAMRTLLLVLFIAPAGLADEIYPVKGEPFKGEVLKVTDKDITYRPLEDPKGKPVTRTIKEILKIDFREVPRPEPGSKYSRVELTDGTILLASKWLLKGSELELTLLGGKQVKMPSSYVSGILNPGQRDDYVREWRPRASRLRGKDTLVVKRVAIDDKKNEVEVISNLEATLGEGDETGTSIEFVVVIAGKAEKSTRKLAGLHGITFKNVIPPQAPPVQGKLLDVSGNIVLISSAIASDKGISVTTPCGAKFDFPMSQVATLDYQKGRYEFLVDMEPTKEEFSSNLEDGKEPEQRHVQKRELILGGVRSPKGMFIIPETQLTYDLRGEYKEFSFSVGKEDRINMTNDCQLIIEGDNRELKSLTINAKEKPQALTLNVKDVQALKLTIKVTGSDFDTGTHIALGDARLVK